MNRHELPASRASHLYWESPGECLLPSASASGYPFRGTGKHFGKQSPRALLLPTYPGLLFVLGVERCPSATTQPRPDSRPACPAYRHQRNPRPLVTLSSALTYFAAQFMLGQQFNGISQ